MGAKYSYSQSEISWSTSVNRTLTTAATGAGSVINVLEILVGGQSGSSNVISWIVNRPGTAGSTLTAQTAEKLHPASPNATHTYGSYGTAPVVSTNNVLQWAMNTFGGIFRWVALPGSEIVVGSQGAAAQLVERPVSGSGTCSGTIIVEEI